MFETNVVVTVTNGKGVLARVAGTRPSLAAEADITHVNMGDEVAAPRPRFTSICAFSKSPCATLRRTQHLASRITASTCKPHQLHQSVLQALIERLSNIRVVELATLERAIAELR